MSRFHRSQEVYMRNGIRRTIGFGVLMLALQAAPAESATVLYDQNFENPVGFVNRWCPVLVARDSTDG